MLVTQMWVRVSTSGPRRPLAVRPKRGHHGALVHLVQRRREVYARGMVSGAAPRSRSALIMAAVWSIHFCMKLDHIARNSALVASACIARPGHRTVRAEPGEERLDAVTPHPARIRGQPLHRAVELRVGAGDHRLEQREQHRLLGREIEVERRTRDARALGQVIDGNVGERALFQQPLGGGKDRLLAVIARRAAGAPAPRGARRTGSHRRYFTRC